MLSILVIEFGANCRKMNLDNSTISKLEYNNKSIPTIILDEFCCEVPQLIITSLIAKIAKLKMHLDIESTCTDKLNQRIEQLLPSHINNSTQLQQTNLIQCKVA